MIQYHDEEWGVPLHDDIKLFEFMLLDTFQAGLSWQIVLQKRLGFREAFDQFNPLIIAQYSETKVAELLSNPAIIRNKAKIAASITNAHAFNKIVETEGSFDAYIWKFSGGKSIDHRLTSLDAMPVKSPESDAMSKDLTAKGFKFVGSTICYAFMQAMGMVNDHLVDCFCHDRMY